MKLDGLTVVRFFAAFWVFLFHFNLRLPLPLPTLIERIISNGALAMPVFFMLSGFVLAHSYRTKYITFNAFLLARVARIYPVYIVGVILSLPFFTSQYGFDSASLALLLPIDLLLLQAWYPNLWAFWHHAGTWSISVEFFLYASFPLLLGLSTLTNRGLILLCVASTLLAGSLIPSLGIIASLDVPFPVFYSIPMYSLPTFTIGIALAELHNRDFKGSAIAPFFLILLLGLAGHFNTRYALFNIATLPLIALTLLFAANPPQSHQLLRLSVNRMTVYLGEISYAFFVYQIPLMLFLDLKITDLRAYPVTSTCISFAAINLLMAALSHRWIEPTGSRWIRRHWPVALQVKSTAR